jgi:hypothetical protein
MVERIIPSELEADELFRRNGEYVSATDYDVAIARIAELRQSLIGGIEAVKAGRDMTAWAEANERLLACNT